MVASTRPEGRGLGGFYTNLKQSSIDISMKLTQMLLLLELLLLLLLLMLLLVSLTFLCKFD